MRREAIPSAAPRKSDLILNPMTGLPSFGEFPQITNPQFAGGPIFLRYGEHKGYGKGWGFEHIWQARFPAILEIETARPLVTSLVTKILIPNATIHYEYGVGKAAYRSTIFRSRAGVLIVEERQDGGNNAFYSIVTAFESRKAHGPVIGAIKE